MNITRKLAVAAALAASVAVSTADTQQWGGTSNLNWSVGQNWNIASPPFSFPVGNGHAPTAFDSVFFENTFYNTTLSNSAQVVNNVVDTSMAAGSLNYTAFAGNFSSTNAFFTTLVTNGVTLTLGGMLGVPALAVGDVPGSGSWLSSGSWTNYSTITGPGTLNVSDSSTTIAVGWRNRATLDLTGLSTFTASVSNLWLGVSSDNPNTSGPTGWILLGPTNNITTSANLAGPGIFMGYATNASGTGLLGLGRVNNLNTDGLVVGGRKSSTSSLVFGPSFSNNIPFSGLVLRGSAGGTTPIPVFSIGDLQGEVGGFNSVSYPGTSSGGTGVADFSGGTVDILADTIYVGRNLGVDNKAQSGTGTGTLIVEHGTVGATNIYVGLKKGTNASGATGTLVVKGDATMSVTNLVLGLRTNGTATTTATLMVSNSAVLNVAGNLYVGNAGPTISLGGSGQINIAGAVTSTGSNTPPTMGLQGGRFMVGSGNMYLSALSGFGTITNVSTVALTNSAASTMTLGVNGAASAGSPNLPGTLNIKSGNLVLSNGVTMRFKLGSSLTPGGSTSDYLVVDGNLASAGAKIDLGFLGIPALGDYDLINYGGSLSGVFTNVFANTTRNFTFTLKTNVANHVMMTVAGGPGANLTWKGGPTYIGLWDTTNSVVWNNNTEKFYTLDTVRFDDTGSATIISVPGTVAMAGMTFSNITKTYTCTPGSSSRITGPGGLTKDGSGLVIWNPSSSSSDFLGPININAGTLQVQASSGFGQLFGSTNKLITVANGATLDAYGSSFGSGNAGAAFGWPISFSGSGAGGVGAIADTKPDTSGPTIFAPAATLTGNATIGVKNSGHALSIAGTAPASTFDLGGNTLTASGSGVLGLNTFIATGSGNILVNVPLFCLRDVFLDGPGTLNLGANTLRLASTASLGWSTTNPVNKAISIGGGTITAPGAAGVTIPVNSAVSLTGNLTITNIQAIRMGGGISGGAYTLTKQGAGNLVLAAANSYSGQTLVTAGTLALDSAGSVPNSPLIRVDAGAALDVTAKPASYTLPAGQTIQMDGAAVGNLTVPAGATISGSGSFAGSTLVNGGTITPGKIDVPRTVTFNSLTLSNASLVFELDTPTTAGGNVNDLVATTTLSIDPTSTTTIKLVPIGPLNTSGGQYTLFTYSGPTLPSSITNHLVLVDDTRYTFSFVDPASTPGSIQIFVGGSSLPVTWKGGATGAPAAWDIKTTLNWITGASATNFANGDTVLFDDSAVTNQVNLIGSLRPIVINMANNALAYTLQGSGALRAGNVTNSGTAGLTIANAADNTLVGDGLVLNDGTVTFNQPTNSIFTANLVGTGSSGSLVKEGTNQLTLVGDNGATYSRPIDVHNGTLLAGWTNALGSGTVTVTNAATLDVNGQTLDAPTVALSGTGVGGVGAVNNTGPMQTNALRHVVLNGDTTLGAVNRWDVSPNGSFQGNGFTLTKVGAAQVWIGPGSDTGLGNVDVQQGSLVFSWPGTDLGTNGSITVRSNAALQFSGDIAAGTKPASVLLGGAIEASVIHSTNLLLSPDMGLSNSYAGNVSFAGTGVIRVTNGAGLTLTGTLQGPAGIQAADVGNLTLAGSNAYTGDLTVNYGSVYVANSNALPAGTTVTVDCTPLNSTAFFNLISNTVTPASVTANLVATREPSGPRTPSFSGSGTWNGPINIVNQQRDPSQFPSVNFGAGNTNDVLTLNGAISQTGTPNTQVFIGQNTWGTIQFNQPVSLSGLVTLTDKYLNFAQGNAADLMNTMELNAPGNVITNFTFSRGRLRIGADNAFPKATTILMPQTGFFAEWRWVFDLNGHSQTVSNIAGSIGPNFGGGIWIGNDSTNADATLVYDSSGNLTNTWACWIVDNLNTNSAAPHKTGLSVLSGGLRLVDNGKLVNVSQYTNSYQQASGPTNNTFSGPTLVSGGTLQVDEPLPATPVTVSGTGKLQGTGPFNVASSVTVNGGTLSPGGSTALASAIGVMTNYGTLTLNSGGNCFMEVNLTTKTNDVILGMSSLTYGGTLTIANVGAQAITNGSIFRLFNATNYIAGPVTMSPVIPAVGLLWDTSFLAVDGTLRVVPVNTNAPTLASSVVGGNLNLSWPADHIGWRLQNQTNSLSVGITNTWFTVPGSTNVNSMTLPINPLNPTVFFRLTYP
jgi:autotransporter-associated beta strand protein